MKDSKDSKNKKRKSEKKEAPSKGRIPVLITRIFFLLFLLVVSGLVIFTYQILYKSDCFFIKEGRIDWLREPLAKAPYERLKGTGAGRNIFEFDISAAADEMKVSHPEFKSIRIIRDFPDRLLLRIQTT